jgi:glycosyltransferase involved in cell wall biosynthesis
MIISVIIPFDKVNDNLYQCIESVYYSNDLDIETILIYDNNKIEGIEKLIKFVSKIKNAYVIFSEKVGISASLNHGIDFSRGSYIARLDSDDFVLPGRFEIQSKYLDENKDCAVVGGQVEYIDENGKSLRKSNLAANVNENLKNGCYIIHPTVMIRKSVFMAVGGYSELFKINGKTIVEDYELWLKISKNHQLRNLKIPVLKYREHKNQSSRIFGVEIRIASLLLRMMYLFGSSEEIIIRLFKSQDLNLIGKHLIDSFQTNYDNSLSQRLLLKDVFLFYLFAKNISFGHRVKVLYRSFKIDSMIMFSYFLKEIYATQSWRSVLFRYLRN